MGVMMRSYVLRALALAVLVLPSVGEAAPGPFRWKEPLTKLQGANVQVVESDTTFSLGFDFQLYGQTFNEVRVGRKGYVTLGYNGTDPIPAANPEALPAALNSSNQPGNLIAVWWGDHHCDNDDSSIKVQTLGIAPEREFRVEWDCYAKTQSGQPSEVGFTAQIVVFENSSVIHLRYGALTIGHDDPADWQTGVRAGIKNQNGTQFSNAIPECGGGSCKRADFPENTVIQYGVWLDNPTWPNNKADVISLIDPDSITHGVDTSSGQAKAWVTIEGQLMNISEHPTSDPVVYRIYLSPTMKQYTSMADTPLLKESGDHTKGEGEILQGHPDPFHVLDVTMDDPSTPNVETRLEIDRDQLPSYALHLCVEAVHGFHGMSPQQEPSGGNNDWTCDPRLLFFGPDLKGGISGYPAQAKPMDVFNVNVSIRNDGNMTADPGVDPIRFTVYLVDAEDPANVLKMASPSGKKIMHPGAADYDAAEGVIGEPIAPGQTKDATITVMVPFSGQIDSIEWYLAVDIGHSGNANPQRAFYVGTQKLEMLLPFLTLPGETFHYEEPMGCVLGEPFRGSATICNIGGNGDGFVFRPELAFAHEGSPKQFDAGIGATIPPRCIGVRKTGGVWEEFDDDSLCQEGEICAYGACWRPCDPEDSLPNNGCDAGFRCLRNPFLMAVEAEQEYACAPFLANGECHEYTFENFIPTTERELSTDVTGPEPYDKLPDPAMLMPTLLPNAEGAPALNQGDYWPLDLEVERYMCQWPRPDIRAVNMSVPLPVLEVYAGNPFNVERRFANSGTLSTTFEYGYYISNVPELSALQIPVPVLGSSDDLGRSWVERRILDADWNATDGVDQRYDTVVVPAGTPPGDYYFGVVVDPDDKISELSEGNNIFIYPRLLRVLDPTVRIETCCLPTGTVGVRYNHSLWASGGMGGYHWEKVEGFPAWLDLDPETGHLSGIPDEERDYVLTVRVRSGAIVHSRTFSLRVLAPEGKLSIPQHVLPPAATGQPYGPVELKANGGKPPYKWTALPIDGVGMPLPPGFCMTPDGVILTTQHCPPVEPFELVNVPRVVEPGAHRFLAVVEDSRGATDIQELAIFVTGDHALEITTEILPAATVGVRIPDNNLAYCIQAQGPTGAVFEWTVTGLPRGLGIVNQSNMACIAGIPEEFGAFMVTATASYQGMQASRTWAFNVANQDLHLVRSHLGTFLQGASVDEKIETSEEATISILQGRLPSGLALEGDRIRGVISPSAEPGNYSLLLELRTPTGRVSPAGLGITVAKAEAPETEEKKADEGCGSSATGSSPASGMGFAVAMLGLLGTLISRRNRSAESN